MRTHNGTDMHPANSRRDFLKRTAALAAAGTGAYSGFCGCAGNGDITAAARKPNIVLVITDDQGYGDIGCHGNDIIKTPHLDRLATESIELARFYVCPTCAPTRAGLLTGRYHHRTGVMGVMSGEALIAPDETTAAAILGAEGYHTGIFGKWHLGDNYPRRPIDMGFDEELVHTGGGMSQPSDPPGVGYHDPEHQARHGYVLYDNFPHWVRSNNYFDPVLRHNGVFEHYEGYCTDIFFDAAMGFIERHREEPFFVHLATNAPHSPEIVSEKYLAPYREQGLDETTARCYAMIENIDDNMARLTGKLAELGIDGTTILIFMGDNGPQYDRYNGGLRGRKAQMYEGGIRVPFFARWPGHFPAGSRSETPAANIDILPSMLAAAGIDLTTTPVMDGIDIMPLLTGGEGTRNRTLFFQGNNGVPERYNMCAVVTDRYKLVNGSELYDLAEDPGETTDTASSHPEIVADLRRRYEAWFSDVAESRGYDPQLIWVGTEAENPVTLTPQDWRGPRSRFVSRGSHGWWDIDVKQAGSYRAAVRFDPLNTPRKIVFTAGDVRLTGDGVSGETEHEFGPFELSDGPIRLETWIQEGDNKAGVRFLDVERL